MNLIIGLGNPTGKYDKTPHNVGFETIDLLAHRNKIALKKSIRFKAEIGEGLIEDKRVVLFKPYTFMNLSGNAVAPYMRKKGIELNDIIVIYDDIDLPLGKLRFRPNGSAAGHNGMKSIIEMLGTNEFNRLRIGIQPDSGINDLASYVLSPFRPSQRKIMDETLDRAAQSIEYYLKNGMHSTMNKFN